MGHKHSQFRRPSVGHDEKIDPQVDPLHDQTIRALKLARDRDAKTDLTIEKLLLKFPALEKGFEQLHASFKTGDSEADAKYLLNKRVPLQEARKARFSLGIKLSDEEADVIFGPPSEGVIVLFLDYMVAIGIIIMNQGLEKVLEEGGDKAVVDALLMAFDAFNTLDSDHNGLLYREDITGSLRDVDGMAHAPKKQDLQERDSDPIMRRWNFMDYDKDGRASFRDFLASLHTWVMESKAQEAA